MRVTTQNLTGSATGYKPMTAHDLRDFQKRWAAFHPIAKSMYGLPDLSQDQAETLYWLIELSNQACTDTRQPLPPCPVAAFDLAPPRLSATHSRPDG
ncbi:hypothetical protein [uncultured Tateyamaria sp.]|uniref:hypothetical protein n=1 Tax=uncultured Tateyamaria sp. TaxID=455651 RepID=UPI002621AF9C|nr:hypothetical protein [uncultured Tateyamaria sp.]